MGGGGVKNSKIFGYVVFECPLSPKICCIFENLSVNHFTFIAHHSAKKFSIILVSALRDSDSEDYAITPPRYKDPESVKRSPSISFAIEDEVCTFEKGQRKRSYLGHIHNLRMSMKEEVRQ